MALKPRFVSFVQNMENFGKALVIIYKEEVAQNVQMRLQVNVVVPLYSSSLKKLTRNMGVNMTMTR